MSFADLLFVLLICGLIYAILALLQKGRDKKEQ
jgi:hypothetical protein